MERCSFWQGRDGGIGRRRSLLLERVTQYVCQSQTKAETVCEGRATANKASVPKRTGLVYLALLLHLEHAREYISS